MNRLLQANLVLILVLMLGVGVALASEGVHWGYEGEHGPDHWGELSPDYAACSAGKEQSPINIPASAPVHSADIVFNYQPSALNITNNGHAIQVNYDPGSSMTVEGKTYNLLQFHFHSLSEHMMNDRYYDMEMHLVHRSADGEYAVVSVMLDQGAENSAYTPVWGHMPAEEGETETISGVTVNATDLLPQQHTYYRYDGSFTTPPCTEGVKWFVMNTSVGLSGDQIGAFRQIYDGNYRPVQALNDRTFLGATPTLLPVSGAESANPAPTGLVLAGIAVLGLGTAGYALRRRRLA
jgi:carbonic anhydrase